MNAAIPDAIGHEKEVPLAVLPVVEFPIEGENNLTKSQKESQRAVYTYMLPTHTHLAFQRHSLLSMDVMACPGAKRWTDRLPVLESTLR